MKDDKNRKADKDSHEKFPPENTPAPPQIINPESDKERKEKSSPVPGNTDKQAKPGSEKKGKPKLLGESEIEIDDETTI